MNLIQAEENMPARRNGKQRRGRLFEPAACGGGVVEVYAASLVTIAQELQQLQNALPRRSKNKPDTAIVSPHRRDALKPALNCLSLGC